MEVGRERLTRDSVRDAARQEVQQLKRENAELKQLVGDLSLEGLPSQEDGHPEAPGAPGRRSYQRMGGSEKAEVLNGVASSPLPKRKVLRELNVPRSTYYRWLRRQNLDGLEDHSGGGKPPWNRLTSLEVDCVLATAREMPELSCRQLAA